MAKKRFPSTFGTDQRHKTRSLAQTFLAEGNIDEAIKAFEKALRLNPKDLPSILTLASLYEDQKSLKKSIDILNTALEFDSKNAMVIAKLGAMHLKTADYAKANVFATQALDLAPERSDSHILFGSVMQQRGKLPLALKHFRKAITIQLESPTPPPQKKNTSKKTDFNTPQTEALLWDTLSMLAAGGVHAFASHGTLLGLVREGGLLPFDKDIDIGIPFSECTRAKNLLQKNGWRQQTGNFGLINPVSFLHTRTKVTVDLCGYSVEKDSGKTIYGFWMEGIPKEWNRIIETDTITLEKSLCPSGRPIWQVTNPEIIFVPFYGNWKVPDKEFEGVTGEPGLRGASLLTQCYGLSRIYSSLTKGNKPRAVKQAAIMQSHLPNDIIYRHILDKLT